MSSSHLHVPIWENNRVKFLCFSDLHRDAAAAKKIVDLSSDADIVIGAGDFATRRRRRGRHHSGLVGHH